MQTAAQRLAPLISPTPPLTAQTNAAFRYKHGSNDRETEFWSHFCGTNVFYSRTHCTQLDLQGASECSSWSVGKVPLNENQIYFEFRARSKWPNEAHRHVMNLWCDILFCMSKQNVRTASFQFCAISKVCLVTQKLVGEAKFSYEILHVFY